MESKKYEVASLRKPQHIGEIGRDILELYHVFGVDLSRRDNLAFIQDDVIVYAMGTAVCFENIRFANKEYLMAVDEGGVGCVAVHPSRKMLAVGGRGCFPKIYIYNYPELEVLRVLSNGSERGYANISFSASGTALASLSSAPDYLLTVWNWNEEKVALKSKAFGQDIFRVRFSEDDDRRLTTCGTGHIRFWKMANTFTGLKLQGYIGKFGKIELSDISSFVELPDGKVVSGTESGSLLLWEGNFIKCRFVQISGALCHEGEVTHVSLDRKERVVVTAGMDGYIRWWDYDSIDSAEVDADHSMDFNLQVIGEFRITSAKTAMGQTIGVKSMIDSGIVDGRRTFVVQDSRGRTVAITFPLTTPADFPVDDDQSFPGPQLTMIRALQALRRHPNVLQVHTRRVADSHSKRITGMDACPERHIAVTGSEDGTIRLWDYIERKIIARRDFGSAVTCVRWVPSTCDPSSNSVAIGFADGIVRVLSIEYLESGAVTLKRKQVFKPHNDAVIDISFSVTTGLVATAGRDGIVFFLKCPTNSKTWTPIKFINVCSTGTAGKQAICCESLAWNLGDAWILMSCNDGLLRQVDVSILVQLSATESDDFLIDLPVTEFTATLLVPKENASTASLASAASSATNPPSSPTKGEQQSEKATTGDAAGAGEGSAESNEPTMIATPLRMGVAIYDTTSMSVIAGGMLGSKQVLVTSGTGVNSPGKEIFYGLFGDGKEFSRPSAVTSLRHSVSKRYIIIGTADGNVVVRPNDYSETFVKVCAHNGSTGGVASAVTSYDDSFLLSAGKDGTLVVYQMYTNIIDTEAPNLHKDIEAGVFQGQVVKPTKKVASEDQIEEPRWMTIVEVSDFRDDLDDTEEPIEIPEEELTAIGGPSRQDEEFIDGPLEELPIDTIEPPSASQSVKTPSLADAAAAAAATIAASKTPEPAVDVPTVPDEANDIPPSAYSIQDAKLKMEEDARRVAAEVLKGKVREQVRVLQREFAELKEANQELPDCVRLTAEQLALDADYFEQLRGEGLALAEEMHKERAYESEKCVRLLKKISTRLMSGLLIEEMPLFTFNRHNDPKMNMVVKSLRTRGVSPEVQELLDNIQKMVKLGEIEEAQHRATDVAKMKAQSTVEEFSDRIKSMEETSVDMIGKDLLATATHAKTGRHTGSAAVARREMRRVRKNQLANHEKDKPNEDQDDPRDVIAIQQAEKRLGDYKLKCADDYEVPEEYRVNAVKKRRQMALLEESMVTMRLQFNERFLALRALKKDIIYAIRRDNNRIREIDFELSQQGLAPEEPLWEPSVNTLEFPDDRGLISDSELRRYIAERQKKPWNKINPPAQSIVSGASTVIPYAPKSANSGNVFITAARADESLPFGPDDEGSRLRTIAMAVKVNPVEQFLADPSVMDVLPNRDAQIKEFELRDSALTAFRADKTNSEAMEFIDKIESSVPVLMFVSAAKKKKMGFSAVLPDLEVIRRERIMRLEFERRSLLQNIESNVHNFDLAIDELRADRHAVLADLKLTELKLVVQYQEYQLLQTFEARDTSLQQKQLRCANDKAEVQASAAESKTKLDAKAEELASWNEKSAQIVADLKALLPDNNPHAEILTKIFKKKIKRKKAGTEGDEEESDDDEDLDDDEEDIVEDALPLNCDPVLYERVLDLREKRLDAEEISTEIQKVVDDLKKSIDRLKQREKQITKDTLQAELEMQQFQLQKQAALNQIDIAVPLRLSQLYVFETSSSLTIPSDQPPIADQAAENPDLQVAINNLRDVQRRRVVADIGMKSHVLINRRSLKRLDERIGELHIECAEAKSNFQELHKERVRLNKERSGKKTEIEDLEKRCMDLQMLKFGRGVDLDELEADADRTKEDEAEELIHEIEDVTRKKTEEIMVEINALKEKLAQTTTINTQLLNAVADLTESKLNITRALNAGDQSIPQDSDRVEQTRDKEERARISSYVQLQAREIESLRIELFMLKRKDTSSLTMPTPLPPTSTASVSPSGSPPNASFSNSQSFLPPIPSAKK